MRWHTKPITQLVVMFVVMLVVIGAQSTASAFLTGNPQNKSVAKVEDTGLIKVVAPTNNCNTSQVTFGQTESNPNNAEPRQPISTHRCEYDVFGPNCFNQTDNFPLAITEHGNGGYVDRNASMQIGSVAGIKDLKVGGMMESIFGFTPRGGFQDVKVFEYGSAWGDRGGEERTRGDAPAVKVPVPQGHSVCMPDTLYDIGGGEAMVVFASSDRITLHIGRHEYIVGTTNNCGGQHCSGGYWIYINGISVDSDIVDAYNSIKSAQEAAGANLTPISLPIVQAKRRLGTARAQNSIIMTIWDDGRMLPLNDNHYWGTNFDDGGAPPVGSPTTIPTVPATPPPPAAGKGNIQMKIKNRLVNFPCSAQLVGHVQLNPGGNQPLHKSSKDMSSFSLNQEDTVNFANLDPGAYLYRSDYGLYNSQNGSIKLFGRSSTPAQIPIEVVANRTIIVQQDITAQGAFFDECVAATPPVTSPTVPPGTSPTAVPTVPLGTPTVAPTGPVTNLPGQRTIRVTVSNSCNEPACEDIRELINDINTGRLENNWSRLHWQLTNSLSGQSITSGFTNGFSQSDQYFTFLAPQFDLNTLDNVKTLVLTAELADPRDQRFYFIVNRNP